MSRILIAYATGEGQTKKITKNLAGQFKALGHTVRLANLGGKADWPDPARHDAVVVAASVHAGSHQRSARRFVRQHRAVLTEKGAVFLSVSMSAAATKKAGLRQAGEQVEAFLDATKWSPAQVETVAGAFRLSRLSWFQRTVTRMLQSLFRKELRRLGWPEDLSRDAEYTDWAALRRFGERFAAGLPAPRKRPARSRPSKSVRAKSA